MFIKIIFKDSFTMITKVTFKSMMFFCHYLFVV